MKIQLNHEEQYTLLMPDANADAATLQNLAQMVAESMEAGHKNFILHLQNLKALPDGFAATLENLQQIILKEDGLLVVSAAPQNFAQQLNEREIVTTPTLDEATDYIFMEEIEKQLRGEDGDDGALEDWETE